MTGAGRADELPSRAPFEALLSEVTAQAGPLGVTSSTLDRLLRGLSPDFEVLQLVQRQPEHTQTAGSYLNSAVSATRIEAGARKLAEYDETLRRIEAVFGVDRHVIVAIWGVESDFGAATGEHSAVRSLATLAAYHDRRQEFWRRELLALLQIAEQGDAPIESLTGSWAGAMGHTQFMPTSILAYAVDFDADGRTDVRNSIPDALASTANYLRAFGWNESEPWGFEVVVPESFDYARAAPSQSRPLSSWRELPLRPALGAKLPEASGDFEFILPAGAHGPAFLVGPNFKAILRYNTAVTYALSVAHLTDRLAGGHELKTPWPASDAPLDRAAREELQRRLVARGLPTGGVDGIIGAQTREAIRTFQKAVGLPQDGHPTRALLSALEESEGNPSAPTL